MGKKPGKQSQANSREAIRSNTILTRENQKTLPLLSILLSRVRTG